MRVAAAIIAVAVLASCGGSADTFSLGGLEKVETTAELCQWIEDGERDLGDKRSDERLKARLVAEFGLSPDEARTSYLGVRSRCQGLGYLA